MVLVSPVIFDRNSSQEFFNNSDLEGASQPRNKITQLNVSDPIIISGNSDFDSKAVTYQWPGNGSSNNPYIIENLQIINNSAGMYGIRISSISTKYFILRNNYIEMTGTGSSGIYLSSTNNVGTIENNTLYNNTQYGLYLSSSNGNTIINNYVSNNHEVGISLSGSDSNVIEYNTIVENTEITGGIQLQNTNNNQINHNNISYNYYGISHNSFNEYNTYYNNTFSYNSQYGVISFSFFDYNNFSRNYFKSNDYAFSFNSFTDNNIFSGNIFEDNTYGIRINSGSNNNTIYDNIFIDNNEGLSSNIGVSWVYNNTFIGNSYGIHLIFSNYGLFENNTLINNGYAFSVTGADNNTFIDNNVINNSNGIDFTLSSVNNLFYGNNFLHNTVPGTSGSTTNRADNGTYGNFWLKHLGIDNDSNGILDTSYDLAGVTGFQDYFPLSIWNNESFSPEIILTPTNLTYETHSSGNNLLWRALDESPSVYEVLFNGSSQASTPFISRSFFNVSVDGIDLGETNVTIIFRDSDLNEVTQTVFVTVVDTVPPNITILTNITYIEGNIDSLLNWTFTDFHPYNFTLFVEDQVNMLGLWNNSDSFNINVSHHLKGVYNYTLLVQDTSSNYNRSVLLVNIIDGTPPMVSQPTNITYEHGYSGNNITWMATDNYPANYSIYRDGLLVAEGNWTSGVNITIDVDGLSPGEYSYLILAQDTSFLLKGSIVFVIVTPDTTTPIVSNIPNFSINENDTGILLGWFANDLNPNNYELYVNGSSLINGTWQDNVQINYTILNYTPGMYNYSIIVYDINNLTVSSFVLVTVESSLGFFVSHPSDISFLEGLDSNSILWNIIGNRTGSYTIYQDSLNISSGTWLDSQLVNYSLISLSPGIYNFTILLNSSTYEIITDTVMVTVNIDNIDPLLNDESDLLFLENSINNSIQWTFFDDNPDYYELWVNDFKIETDVWPFNDSLMFSLDHLGPGAYNYTLFVYDLRGNYANDTVLIFVVDVTAPVISSYPGGPNVTLEYGHMLNLTWQAYDYSSTNYTVYVDNLNVITNVWINNSLTNFSISNLNLGNHNVTIVFRDFYGLTSTHEVLVIVEDITKPELSSPLDLSFTEGVTEAKIINWSVIDDFNGTYLLYRNGTLNETGFWSGSVFISIDVSSLSEGAYNFTLIVTDFSGNTKTDIVEVTVLSSSSEPPSSSEPSSLSTTSTPQIISSAQSTSLSTTSLSSPWSIFFFLVSFVLLFWWKKKKLT